MTKLLLYFLIISLLLTASCAGNLYSHYPKVKQKNSSVKAETEEKPQKIFPVALLSAKAIRISCSDSFSVAHLVLAIKLPALAQNEKKFDFPPEQEIAKGIAGRSDDVTKTNKEAKTALVSSVAALGFVLAGLFVLKLFLAIGVILAVIAFIYAIIARRKIKQTGEYGRKKTDIALLISIPILFVTLGFLITVIFWNTGGFQLGTL